MKQTFQSLKVVPPTTHPKNTHMPGTMQVPEVGTRVLCVCRAFPDDGQKEGKILEIKQEGRQSPALYYVHFNIIDSRHDDWYSADELQMVNENQSQSQRQTSRHGGHGTGLRRREGRDEEHISLVRNIERIVFGDVEIRAWYFSPYPDEYGCTPLLYICPWCLKYMRFDSTYRRHLRKCEVSHPPGDEIYRDANVSFYELDGRKSKLYCQNLCLLTRLFLEHKTLEYDIDPFLFYCMTVPRDDGRRQLVGYFSKEKESTNVLACILSIPCYQRMGYGQALIEFAYMLAKREGRIGSPERPLSDLGKMTFTAYWRRRVAEYLLRYTSTTQHRHISVMSIVSATSIHPEDVCLAMSELEIVAPGPSASSFGLGLGLGIGGGTFEGLSVDGTIVISPQSQKNLEVEAARRPKLVLEERCLHWFPYPSMVINNINQVFKESQPT